MVQVRAASGGEAGAARGVPDRSGGGAALCGVRPEVGTWGARVDEGEAEEGWRRQW